MNSTFTSGLLALALLFSGSAFARKIVDREPSAEALQDRMMQLARKNAWQDVEQAYSKLLELRAPMRPASHVLGGVAAHLDLDIGAAIKRLSLAGKAGQSELAAVQRAYGQVILKPAQGGALRAEALPEDPRARALFEQAASTVAEQGDYQGWLPVGVYRVGEQSFAVAANGTIRVR